MRDEPPADASRLRVAFVVQRYGEEVVGGSEHLCRRMAERMRRHWDIDVLTTCALDYRTWADHYPPGSSSLNGVRVRRFPVDAPRDVPAFDALSAQIYGRPHGADDEQRWLEAQGPRTSGLFAHLRSPGGQYDLVVFFTYLYATTAFGLPLVDGPVALVPTAHDEPPIHLGCFDTAFRTADALFFLTPEEQTFVNRRFGTADTPQDVVGSGLDPVDGCDPPRFLAGHAEWLEGRPFVAYAGRFDASKGVHDLIRYFLRFREDAWDIPAKLVLMGSGGDATPVHPDILHLGVVDEQTKLDALAAARAVVVPSAFESLSYLALEAWSVGTPVLANAASHVLEGQCRRANGGLAYRGDRPVLDPQGVSPRRGGVSPRACGEQPGRHGSPG